MRGHQPCTTAGGGTWSQKHRGQNLLLSVSALSFRKLSLGWLLLTSRGPSCTSELRAWDLWGKLWPAVMSPLGFTSRSLLRATPLFPGARSWVGIWRLQSEQWGRVWLRFEGDRQPQWCGLTQGLYRDTGKSWRGNTHTVTHLTFAPCKYF